MISKARIMNKDGTIEDVKLYNSISFDERLDEQLDTGNIQIITNSESVSFADFCPVELTVEDVDETKKTLQFCGFISGEKRGLNYYIHNLELVEPTRMLMGMIIEGVKVTQPIEGSGKAKKSLLDVLSRLLWMFETRTEEDKIAGITKFSLYLSEELQSLLQNTESPEFHWEAGTLLWECLCDIGNVINAIPRLYSLRFGKFEYIKFDLINEPEKEYEL
jgi:hypothetical protein